MEHAVFSQTNTNGLPSVKNPISHLLTYRRRPHQARATPRCIAVGPAAVSFYGDTANPRHIDPGALVAPQKLPESCSAHNHRPFGALRRPQDREVSQCTRFPKGEQEIAKPSIADAFKLCVQQGANRVVISPFFLSPGRHCNQDVPALAAEAAREHPGISSIVTAPLGLHELLVDRIRHCLSHVAGDTDECDVCAGTGKCCLH